MAHVSDAATLPRAMTDDIVASASDGILTVDSEGRLTSLNPEAESIFGLKASEVFGLTFAEVFLLQEEWDAFSDCVIEAINQPEVPHSADITVTIGGRRRHLSVRANLLRNKETQSPIGVLVVVSDQSERVELLEQTAEQEQERAAIGRFVVTILTIFSVFTLLLEPIQKLAQAHVVDLGPFAALLTLVVIAFFITRWTGSSLRDYGLKMDTKRRDMVEMLVWSIALCVLMTIGRAIHLAWSTPEGAVSPPLFAFFVLDDGTKVETLDLYAMGLAVYLVSVLFQEFATRCAIQAPLEKFLKGVVASPGWIANLTATLLFAVLHAHLNPAVSLAVIVPSLLWGWLFMRSGSVVTPIISHAIIGVYAVFVLGLFAGLDQV